MKGENQITFIGLVSSKSYYRQPRIIIGISDGGIRRGGPNLGGRIGDGLEGNMV